MTVSVNYSPTTKVINNLVVENNTGLVAGKTRRNVHAKIILDGEVVAEHAGDETYVFKGFPPVTAVTVTVDGQTYDQPPENTVGPNGIRWSEGAI